MFLTLLTHNLEGSRSFYERLGCTFTEEQHGQGSKHWSVTMPMTFELYPPLKSLPGTESLFIGFETHEDSQQLKRELIEKHGGLEHVPPIPTSQSGIVSLRDPSGLLVRLFPKR